MKFFKLTKQVAAGCTAILCITSAAEPLSILGLTTGISASKAREAIPSFECLVSKGNEFGDESCRIFGSGKSTIQYGNVVANSLVAYFYDDKLAKVVVRFPEPAFPSISAGLEVKFGAPGEQKETAVRNRSGATFPSKEMLWKLNTDELSAIQRAGKLDEAQVTLTSHAAKTEFARRVEEKAKATAGKL